MKHRYTVIYRDDWRSGGSGRIVTNVKMVRIEVESLSEWIKACEYADGLQFIFEGWPLCVGEDGEDAEDSIRQHNG